MAWRSASRSLFSTARTSISRSSSSSLPRLRSQPHLIGQRINTRRLLSTSNLGAIGCTQSLLPLHSVVAATRLTSHISVEARAWCELTQDDDRIRIPVSVSVSCPVDTGTAGFSGESEHHSISLDFLHKVHCEVQSLDQALTIELANQDRVPVSKVYPRCELPIAGHCFQVDLIPFRYLI